MNHTKYLTPAYFQGASSYSKNPLRTYTNLQLENERLKRELDDSMAEIKSLKSRIYLLTKAKNQLDSLEYQIRPGTNFWNLMREEFPNTNQYDLYKELF